MPRGTPDWAQVAPQDLLARVLDDAEVAARLGSSSLFDRRGNVIYATTFGGGTPGWINSGVGGAAFARVSHRAAYLGGYSLRITSGTSSVTRAEATIVVPLMTTTPIGIEWVMVADFVTVLAGVNLLVRVGTAHTEYGFRYDYGDTDLERLDDGGSFVSVDDATIYATNLAVWSHIKYVIDPVAREYVRARAGSTLYDLSGLGGEQSVGSALHRIDVTLHSLDDSGAEHGSFFGLLLVTVNE